MPKSLLAFGCTIRDTKEIKDKGIKLLQTSEKGKVWTLVKCNK